MENVRQNLEQNARLLRSGVSKYALFGLLISLLTILIATCAVSYQMTGAITIEGMILAQKSNVALMILDLTPFLFMLWGQSVSSMMSYTAGAMVIDQTHDLRMQTSELSSRVEHEASHDLLTELPNRILYIDRLNQAIPNLKGKTGQMAVMVININNFKELNTGFGTFNADRLLKQFAQRLKYSVSEPATVARFSGDEFAILLPHIENSEEAIDFAKKLQKSLSINFALDSVTLDISASMGITFYPKHGQDEDTLIQRANVALYHAKQEGKSFSVYERKMDKECPNKLILMSELRRAIESEQLILTFQPKVKLENSSIAGCETLLYWNHPTFGLMDADKFIPVAERTGLIKSITQYVLKKSISHASQWYKRGKPMQVSVNLSVIDILDIELPSTVESMLNIFDFPAPLLTLEIIESSYLGDKDRAMEVINRLSELGVKIAIDDFGTGYSSFLYLTQLRIDEIKIDRSFIKQIEQEGKYRNIVHAMIDLAKATDIHVVAEGIENIQQQKLLKEMHCEYGQGFYFSRSLDAEAFEALISHESRLPEGAPDLSETKHFKVVEGNKK